MYLLLYKMLLLKAGIMARHGSLKEQRHSNVKFNADEALPWFLWKPLRFRAFLSTCLTFEGCPEKNESNQGLSFGGELGMGVNMLCMYQVSWLLLLS